MSCVLNPYYVPGGNGVDDYNPIYIDTNTLAPCSPTGQTIPSITVTGAGMQGLSTVLDKWLNAGLSALSLLKGAKKIPTTLDPANDYGGSGGVDPRILALLAQQQQNSGGGSNTGAKVENWVKNNTGVVAIAAVVIGAYLLKSPRK